MKRWIWSVLLGGALAACGGSGGRPEPVVLAQTGTADAGASADLDDLVRQDAQAAARVLNESLGADDPRVAAYAAAYARRLGIVHDRAASGAALVRGVEVDDQLARALSWRWLAADPEIEPPALGGDGPGDPVVALFAALAAARGGELSPQLASACGVPADGPRRPVPPPPERREQLAAAVVGLDDGPLALALAFVEARRERWTEPGAGGRNEWVAARLRAELIAALGGAGEPPAALDGCSSPADPAYSALAEQVETPLLGAPLEVLRGAALKAEGGLRIGALRALAVVGADPRAGDLAVAAAALHSADPLVRVEAARTYLLLAARATEGP